MHFSNVRFLGSLAAVALLGVHAGQAQSSGSIPARVAGGFAKFSPNSKIDSIEKAANGALTHTTATFPIPANIEAFQQFVLPDYLVIHNKGAILTKEQNIDELKKAIFSSLKILDPQIRSLSPTSALIVARVQFEATINGQKMEGEQATSTVWVNQGGKWLAQLHTATFRQ